MNNSLGAARGSVRRIRVLWSMGLLATMASCGGGAARGTGAAAEAEWRALASERPIPLAGAVRLTFTDVELLSEPPWSLTSDVPLPLGISELVVAGLLRRRDVHFVERRRFSAAVAAERAGARRVGVPAAGISPGAELTASVEWVMGFRHPVRGKP